MVEALCVLSKSKGGKRNRRNLRPDIAEDRRRSGGLCDGRTLRDELRAKMLRDHHHPAQSRAQGIATIKKALANH